MVFVEKVFAAGIAATLLINPKILIEGDNYYGKKSRCFNK